MHHRANHFDHSTVGRTGLCRVITHREADGNRLNGFSWLEKPLTWLARLLIQCAHQAWTCLLHRCSRAGRIACHGAISCLFFLGLPMVGSEASAAEPSRLVLESLPDQRVRLVWTNIGERFEFQESTLQTP